MYKREKTLLSDPVVGSLNLQLDKGMPSDPRMPAKALQYTKDMAKRQDALVAFLEHFKSRFAEHTEAAATIAECEAVLNQFSSVVQGAKVTLDIQIARVAKDGALPYGLEHFLARFTAAVCRISFCTLFAAVVCTHSEPIDTNRHGMYASAKDVPTHRTQ